MTYTADIAVIGGGASGLAAAITAKRANPDLEVFILEALSRVGKKLITTGNGRCNITNKKIDLSFYHGEDVSFARFALNSVGDSAVEEFFKTIGIPFVFEEDKAYPASLQAASVVDCLRFECERIGVKTLCDCRVEKLHTKGGFTLISGENKITARAVIAASGLYSGGEKLGSDGSVLRLFKDMGYPTVKATPAIVQLKTETEYARQLKGIKVNAKATLLKGNTPLRNFSDEVLFCDYGLSGPAIMQISRDAVRNEGEYYISLDLYENMSEDELTAEIEKRKTLLKCRNLEEFFTGMLNKRLGQVVLKYAGYKLLEPADSLDAKKVAMALKGFRFKVLSHTGFNNSQVTAGGLSTKSFDDKTMMSKKHSGLFACGEILDIDGDCGGFNLRFAWSSGILAGKSAALFLGK